MQDAESELRRRRDRGKVAQRAFRQRQSEALRKLKEEHETLKGLVVEIVDSAGVDIPAQLKTAIIKAGNAVGLDITGLAAENVQSFNKYPEESSTGVLPPAVGLSTAQGPCTETLVTQSPSIEENIVVRYDSEWPKYFSQNRVERSTQDYYGQSGRMSPRFDYGVWLDPGCFVKIKQPPIDIVPYLGARMRTVAGHIVRACLDYASACLRDVIKNPISNSISPGQVADNYPSSLPPNSASRAFFDISLRHSKPLHDVVHMATLIEERMEFFTLEYVQGDNQKADEGSRQIREERLLEFLVTSGFGKDQWWSPLEVEKYIGEKMGACEFALFQAALSCEEAAQIQVLRPLAWDLAKNSVCSGHGPVWKPDYVRIVVTAWVCGVGRLSYQ